MSIDVSIIGGGVAGLSAALLTSKNGLVTHVFDTGDAGVSKAILDNYLGIMKMEGPDFIDLSRDQVQSHGAILHQEEEVLEVVPDGGEYRVVTSGGKYISKYIVIATGHNREIAKNLGCAMNEDGCIQVDSVNKTNFENVYAAGWCVHWKVNQAIIAAGEGAAIGIDILSNEKGANFRDHLHLIPPE